MSSATTVPKAILYSWPTSVWSTVPQLCLVEKGYSDDEYIIKLVDIPKGENFSPSYLKINLNGTIPTLVVPTFETTGEDVDTRYRSLRDTTAICNFLDQARSAGSHNTVSDKPAPALSPATIEGKSTSDALIALVHLPTVDPNFINMAARTADELRQKVDGPPGEMISARRKALQRYIAEAKRLAEDGGSYEAKLVPFLEDKAAANESLWEVYNGQAGQEKVNGFLEASQKAWTTELPDVLTKLEASITGPFALGDQVSLADLHVIAWLTRLVSIADGTPDEAGIDALESQLGGQKIGAKVKGFWRAWIGRESYQKVLVPAFSAFEETRAT